MVDFGGEEAESDTPVEERGISDDLRKKGSVLIENKVSSSQDTYTNSVMDPYSDRERYIRATPMVLRWSCQSHGLRVGKNS